jgi:hypothetical protein
LLLSPFLAVITFLLFERGRRWRYALALVVPTILVILPITIRNMVVFRHLTPISLSAGLNVCEGIADYDPEQRFGLISKDHLVMQWEAQAYNRPDYAGSLFNPDGIERERDRFKRGFAVIKSHPFWFGGVMLRRVGFMLTSEPARLISRTPVITHSLADLRGRQPIWTGSPRALVDGVQPVSSDAKISMTEDETALVITGDDSVEEPQFITQLISLEPGKDYVLQVPVVIAEGRMGIQIKKGDGRTLLASAAVPDALQGFPIDRQPTSVQIPFASGDQKQMQIVLTNGGSKPVRPIARIGRIELFALGESSYGWTRLPRLVVRSVQKFFVTSWTLTLTVIGLFLILLAGRSQILPLLLGVPLYYLIAQAPLHTEYRYVIAIQYFLLVFVAVALCWSAQVAWIGARKATAVLLKQRRGSLAS